MLQFDELHALKKSMLDQQNQLTQQRAEIQSLTQELARVDHTEHGLIDCGSSSSWDDGPVRPSWIHQAHTYNVTKSVRVAFRTPYTKPPVVQLSVFAFHNNYMSRDYYATDVYQVDTAGFTMRCMTFGNGNWHVGDMDVSWISIAASP